jgi:putative hydrolase of HD superfamily
MKIPKTDLDRIARFMIEADKLKTVDRTGWVLRKVKNPENVGDHSYSTALLSYIMAKKLGLDATRCVAMALTHDMNEILTGDIATRANEQHQTVNNHEKAKRENANMLKVIGILDKSSNTHFKELWTELKENKTKEAQLVHEVDKLDYILQLIPYHKYMKKDSEVEEFFITAKRRINTPELLYIYEKVRRQVYKERSK